MILRKIADYLSQKKLIVKIMQNPEDLSEFKQRPTPRLVTGLFLMAFSYLLAWPAVAALSAIAVWYRQPLIAIIGGPVTYGLSYVVFIIGAWLARAPYYMGKLTRYGVQRFVRKYCSKNKISNVKES
ncbi:MAG TPA: hypothetical protein ENN23_01635 [Deltaproteobacteria bacterium]|nr:hypothetical protein [Deltaproteobacteria bacterium]